MAGSLRHLFGSSTDAAALALGSERRVPTDGGAGALQAGDQRTVSRACEGNALFASISKEDRLALFASLYTFHYRPGESIILHGEPGRNFYIIASGKCIVTSASAAVSRTLGPGDTFGELALLTGGKRSASVRVAEGSAGATLWVLDRTVFRKVLSTAAYERRKLYTQLLRDCAPLSGLDDYQRSLLCDAFTPCSWHPGDVILQQGAAEGARFHIIVHGGVTVTVGGIPVKKLGAGAFFGEVALLAPSAIGNAAAAPSATVTAEAARTGTIALGRSAFRRLLSAEQREALSAHVASYIFQAKRPNGVLPAAAAAPKVPGRVSVRSLTSSIAKLVPAAKPRLALRLGLTPRDVVLLKELGNGMTGRVYLARANLASGGSALLVVKVMSKHELVAMNQVREPQPDTIYHRVINATSPKVQNVIKEKEVS
jgi:CRP-like cAMP-binding protein